MADSAARDVLQARGLDPNDPDNRGALAAEREKAHANVQQMLAPMHAEAAARAKGLEGAAFEEALGTNFGDVEKERWRAAGTGDGVSQNEVDRYWAELPRDRLAAEAGRVWDDRLTPEQREGAMGRMVAERADLARGVMNGLRKTQQAVAGTRTSLHENATLASSLGYDPRDHETANYDRHLYGRVSDSLDHGGDALSRVRDLAGSGRAGYADAMYRDMFLGEGAKGLYRPFEHSQQALKDYAEKVRPGFEDLKNAALRGGVEHITGMAETAAENPGTTAALAGVTAAGMYFAPEVALPVLFAVGAKSAFDNTKRGVELYREGMKSNDMNKMLAGAGHMGAAGVDTAFLAADGAATLNAFKSMNAVRASKSLSLGQYAKYQLAARSARLGEAAQGAGRWLRRTPDAPHAAPAAAIPDGPTPGGREHQDLLQARDTQQTRLDRMRRGLEQREAGALPPGRGHGVDGLPTNTTVEQARAQVKKLEAELAATQGQIDKIDAGYTKNRTQLEELLGEGYHGPKPAYEHAVHHDPTHPEFRGRGDTTTPIPADAAAVYRSAIPDPAANGRTWWGRGENGDLYRFQATPNGRNMHWNGATGETGGARAVPMDRVPRHVRQRLGIGDTAEQARALETARGQLTQMEKGIDASRANAGYAGTAEGTMPFEQQLQIEELGQMWNGRMPKIDRRTGEALRNLTPDRKVQVDLGNGPEWTTAGEAIQRASDPNVSNLALRAVEPRAQSLTTPAAIAGKFPDDWVRAIPDEQANALREAMVTFDSGERGFVSGSRQMLEEIASSPNVRSIDPAGDAIGWARPLSDVPVNQRMLGYDPVAARVAQIGDAFVGSADDIRGLGVHHGTIAGLEDSVRAGPQNVGKGFGGPGLYTFLDDGADLARTYSEFARDAAANRAANVGRAGVDTTPTVIDGRVAPDADLRVGRFSLRRNGSPDLANAVLPANWADDPLLVQALLSRFDVLDVRGAKAAGLNLDTDRFLVFHESAGDVIRFAD